MKLKIFFSWQMTTDTKYNKNFILNCIEKAVKKLKNKPELKNVDFEIQEGVNRESGSVQVASTIADERIPNCDIFIADLSVVNYMHPIIKCMQKLFRTPYKPFQNNNVMYEYGVAYSSIKERKIIGVLNNAFGSPNENPSNIPFDLAHIRFPIEYNYSKEKNNKENAENQLVNGLISAIKETAKYALQNQKDKYNPLMVWADWEKYTKSSSQKYFTNEKIDRITNLIKNGIQNPKKSIRLLGLSGLGKTRVLLEAFRSGSDEASIILTSRILYINYSHFENVDYQNLFLKLTVEKENRIVILDNCPQLLHRQLLHFITHQDNRISLVTIDSNPEEFDQNQISGVDYLIIKKEDLSSIVENIVAEDFSLLHKDQQEKIREFSQGIPLMAVLIGESIKNGEQFIGKLDDKELLDKLLGEKGKNVKYRTILKSCSIFNYFGIDDDLKSQIEFIAKNKFITSIDGDAQVIIHDFHETCNYYLKREIFEKKGRFIGMRPFPLAIYLAQEWLESCTPDRLIKIIEDITNLEYPDNQNLSTAFAEQMKHLGYSDKAVSIVEKIIGKDSPFDSAEVLNTQLGSRLFRSFVEVNPVAVSQNFVRLFSFMSKEDLLKIEEGRRNIIWVLEKLCFDKRTFADSAKIMYVFAVAENESIANNATGQLLHLFNILLPGTEADLKERWNIIEWGLNHSEKEYQNLAIYAMKRGLNYGHFSRMGGAETQGVKSLSDYNPSRDDVSEYWINILSKFLEIIKSGNEYSVMASEAIANSIRSICNAGLVNIIIPVVKEIVALKNNDWDDGLKGLKFARKYEKRILLATQQAQINELIETLTKKDFGTRYLTVDSSYLLDKDEPYSSDKVTSIMISLADEFIKTNLSWEEYFPLFYKNYQYYAFDFGKQLYKLIEKKQESVEDFIQVSIDTILEIKREERNWGVLVGFIIDSNNKVKQQFYSALYRIDELDYLLFDFISRDSEGKIYFDLLFDLINKGKCELRFFNVFVYRNALKNLSIDELNEFSEKMFSYGDEGYEIIFDLYFGIVFNNDGLKKAIQPIFRKCILRLGINKKENAQMSEHNWMHTIESILENEDEKDFAIFINNSIIESITFNNPYFLNNNVKRIYEVLMKYHFNTIWAELSKALISNDEEYMKFYGLKDILGSKIGGMGRQVGVLFDGDIDAIFEWCENNKPLAPTRLAELAPIFGENSTWHPVSMRLINEFGDIEDVLSNIGANMGTFSWTGSLVPLLEDKQKLFNLIVNHKIKAVSDWAKKYLIYLEQDIKREKNRDEEIYL